MAEKPDGIWGWVVVLAAFMNLALSDGVFVSMSLITLELIEKYDEPVSKVAWVSSIYSGFMLTSAPLATGLSNKFGYRVVIIAGAVVGSFGFAVSSVVTSVDVLMFTIGVIAGTGFGLVYTPAIAAVSFYFNKRRALATGLAFCGSGVGMFVFPHLTNLLLAYYDLKSTLLLLGGIYLNCAVFGVLYRPVLPSAPEVDSTESEDPEDQPLKPPIEKPANETKTESLFEQMFRPSLFRSYAFILVNISTLISSLGYMIPFTFLAAHAEQLGFDRDEAAFLVSIIGITTCVGPVVGWITDHPKVSALWVNNISMTVCGLLTIFLPMLPTYGLLAFYAAAFGLTISCLLPTRPIMMADMVGLENMSSAFGYMMMFFGITIFFGNPLAGAIFDATGSFDSSFYLAGSMILLSGILCYPLGCLNRWQQKRDNKLTA